MRNSPNVLLILTDQQQAQTIESASPCIMPNVQSLASQGVQFTRAYTPCVVCSPARASLYSSYYPHQHGKLTVVHSRPAMNLLKSQPMRYFPELLRDKGYKQIHVGRWHINPEEDPLVAGYDEAFTVEDVKKKRIENGIGEFFHGHNPDFLESPIYLNRPGWRNWLVSSVLKEPTDLTLDGCIGQAGVKKLKKLSEQQDPWHLTVSFYSPHDPYSCTKEYEDLYDWRDVPKPPNWDDDMKDKPAIYRRHRRDLWDRLTWEEQAKSIARYWGSSRLVDDQIGQLLKVLDETGQAENTIVIFTSDHGDMLGGHGLFLKSILPFEEAWRIPLVIRWPSGIPARGIVNDRFASLLDIAPTILDAAGADVWEDAQGMPLQNLLECEEIPSHHKSFYGEFHGGEYYFTQRIVWGIRYKFVFNSFADDELYDLENDPHEMQNLIDKPEMAEVKQNMFQLYWEKHKRSNDFLDLSYPTIALFTDGPKKFELH